MKFEMSLLENSLDFLKISLQDYMVADEYGTHTISKSNIKNKSKWKAAYIDLVQAIELLFKEILYRANPVLICADIDLSNKDKTVSLQQAIVRITNLKLMTIAGEEKELLEKAGKLRNQFVHGRVNIESEEIKAKYSKLLVLYIKYYEDQFGTFDDFHADTSLYYSIQELKKFSENGVIFRGEEMSRDQLKKLKEEIENNARLKFVVYHNGEKYRRIKFDSKEERMEWRLQNGSECVIRKQIKEYCDDCTAKPGEYHLDNCDLEICPRCHGQLLSCECNKKEFSE